MIRALLLLLLFSCSGGGTEQHLVHLNLFCDPPSLDPGICSEVTSITVQQMIREGLTRVDVDGKPSLALAESIAVSDDGLTYTFSLRHSKWANGDPLTAHDFVRSIYRTLSPGFPAQQPDLLYPIANARAYKFSEADTIGVKALDAHTLQITLEHPAPYLLHLLAHPIFAPIHKDGLEVTNGPFTIDEYLPRQHLIVRANPHFWDPVAIDGIHMIMIDNPSTELAMFEQGALDWAGGPLSVIPYDAVPALRQAGILLNQPVNQIYWYEFNIRKAPLDDVKVRRALAQAIDRERLNAHISQGTHQPALHLFEGHNSFIETLSTLDLKPLTISFNNCDDHTQIAQAIQAQWEEKLGITAQLDTNELSVHLSRLQSGNFEIGRFNYEAAFDDPIDLLNRFRYGRLQQGPEYQAIMDQLDQTRDPKARDKLILNAQHYLNQQMPVAPIFFLHFNYLCNPSLKGVVFTRIGQIDFRWSEWEEPCT